MYTPARQTLPIPALAAARIGQLPCKRPDHLALGLVYERDARAPRAGGIRKDHPLGFDVLPAAMIGTPNDSADDHAALMHELMNRKSRATVENRSAALMIGEEPSAESQVDRRRSDVLRIGAMPPSKVWPNTLWSPGTMMAIPSFRIGEAPPEHGDAFLNLRPYFDKLRLGGPEHVPTIPFVNDIGRQTWDWLELINVDVAVNFGFAQGAGDSLGLPRHASEVGTGDQASRDKRSIGTPCSMVLGYSERTDVHSHLVGESWELLTSVNRMIVAMSGHGIDTSIAAEFPQTLSDPAPPHVEELGALAGLVGSAMKLLAGGQYLTTLMVWVEGNQSIYSIVASAFDSHARWLASQPDIVGFGEIPLLHLSATEDHPYIMISPDNPLLLDLVDIAGEVGLPIGIHMDIVVRDVDTGFAEWDYLFGVTPRSNSNNPQYLTENLSAFRRLLSYAAARNVKMIWDHLGWSMTMDGLINEGGSYLYTSPGSSGSTIFPGTAIFVDEGFLPTLLELMMGDHENLNMSIKNTAMGSDRYFFTNYSPSSSAGFGHDMDWDTSSTTSSGLGAAWIGLFESYPRRFMLGCDQQYKTVSGWAPARVEGTWNNFLARLRADSSLGTTLEQYFVHDNPIRVFSV